MDYIKYPRTWHLPWSEGKTRDDRTLESDLIFEGKEVVVTEKLDGENTTMYEDYIHARSIDGQNHWTRNWVKNFHSQIAHEIPKGWRLCGENLFAKHSIKYKNLESYFYLFSIWDNNNDCLSWESTTEFSKLMNILLVPIIYKGIYNKDKIHNAWKNLNHESEGYVIRLSVKFSYSNFRNSTGKFVRKNHVSTSNHWKWDKIEQNELKYE